MVDGAAKDHFGEFPGGDQGGDDRGISIPVAIAQHRQLAHPAPGWRERGEIERGEEGRGKVERRSHSRARQVGRASVTLVLLPLLSVLATIRVVVTLPPLMTMVPVPAPVSVPAADARIGANACRALTPDSIT